MRFCRASTSGHLLITATVDSKISNNTELLVSYERADVLELVELALNHEDARPLTDHVSVVSAEIIKYSISAHIHYSPRVGSDF